jgi:hypothetical protein
MARAATSVCARMSFHEPTMMAARICSQYHEIERR